MRISARRTYQSQQSSWKKCSVSHYRTIPVSWKKLPTKPWYRNGHKRGCGLCQHLHGQNRERDPRQSLNEPLVGKRYIDDVFSLWNAIRDKIESFMRKVYHPNAQEKSQLVVKVVMTVGRSHSGRHNRLFHIQVELFCIFTLYSFENINLSCIQISLFQKYILKICPQISSFLCKPESTFQWALGDGDDSTFTWLM